MARYWFIVLGRAFWESISDIGQTASGLVFILVFVALESYWFLRSGGITSVKNHIARNIVASIAIGVVAWSPFFLFRLAHTPYAIYKETIAKVPKLSPGWVSDDLIFGPCKTKEGNRVTCINFIGQGVVQPVRLRLLCDTNITGITIKDIVVRSGDELVVEPRWKVADNGEAIVISYKGPGLNMMNTLTLEIESSVPIRPMRVERWKAD